MLKGEPALVDSTSPRRGEKVSYYSAVCLETGEVAVMELEGNSNAGTSTAFLRQLRGQHPEPLIVIWDNSPAHRGDAIRAYLTTPNLNLRLVNPVSSTGQALPSYSPDFNADEAIWGWVRQEATANIRREYQRIRDTEKYADLPPASSAAIAQQAMDQWESEHPEECSRLRDEGQVFGFTQVAQGYLGRYTKFIRVPAVRDPQEDAIEKRGSCVTEIMDLVVRSVLSKRQDIADFQERTQAEYSEIFDPNNMAELQSLQSDLSETLHVYAPDSQVHMNWSEMSDISIPLPQAQVKLTEDGYESAVDRTGHGLQRAFIVTMLQHLVAARSRENMLGNQPIQDGTSENLEPNLVLAIEEPELYQHPSRQRHLSAILLDLASGTIPGVSKNTQVIYTTHSPLFIGLDRFPQIRVLRKIAVDGGAAKATTLMQADMNAVAAELGKAAGPAGAKFTAETLRGRLQTLMTPWMNEGFFADTVVLVEGEDDRAAVVGVAASMGHDFDSSGQIK